LTVYTEDFTMAKLLSGIAILALTCAVLLPVPAGAAEPKSDGIRAHADQYEFSAHRRAYRHRHVRRYYGPRRYVRRYWGPPAYAYYPYGYYRPRPFIGVGVGPFGFGFW
jgi:hypothetical protein